MIDSIVDGYTTFTESGDKRVNEWMFMKSPMPTVIMTITYLSIVKVIGPKLMQNRPAFDLRNVMIIYNFAMVFISLVMFIEMANLIQWGRYIFQCQKVDTSTADVPMRMCNVGWWFLVTKYIEYMDTVFFVLRKKQDHVSKLHVIHHSAVPFSVWVGLKFAPGGNNAIFPVLNSGVHTVMYLYYGLAAFGPKMQKYLWWKKHLTSLQLLQFVLVMVHGLINYIYSCDFPRVFIVLNLSNAVLFFFLFSSFYRQSYRKSSASASKSIASKSTSLDKTFTDEKTDSKIGKVLYSVSSKYWAKCSHILPIIKSCLQLNELNMYYGERSEECNQKHSASFVALKPLKEEQKRKFD